MTKKAPRFNSEQKRELWRHEDELINHRLNWLGVTQGLLFAGYVLATEKGIEKVLNLLAIAGLLTSGLILVGVCAALISMHFIHKDGPEEEKHHFGVRRFTTYSGWFSAAGIPLIFFAIWWLIIGC